MKNLTEYGNRCIANLNAIGIYPNKIERFEINSRAKRRWGQAVENDGVYTININISLLADECPENALLSTIYHELLHCVDGCMNHGDEWQHLANRVNKYYSTDIKRCHSTEEKVGSEYAQVIKRNNEESKNTYIIHCLKCNGTLKRIGYRAPKWYAHCDEYRCKCGGRLERY